MGASVDDFIRHLTARHRVLVIGGLAVIGHGLSRSTKDADVWLDPAGSADEWAEAILDACRQFPEVSVHRLPGWQEVAGEEIAEAAEDTGMIRIQGLNCPLDIFRRPNEFKESAFDEVAGRATANDDGTLLPDPLDLLQTKLDTDRAHDQSDILHLEQVTRRRYFDQLPKASLEEAEFMLNRFADWQVLRVALTNPDPAVQDLARGLLEEFAKAGDPFSQAILEGRPIIGE